MTRGDWAGQLEGGINREGGSRYPDCGAAPAPNALRRPEPHVQHRRGPYRGIPPQGSAPSPLILPPLPLPQHIFVSSCACFLTRISIIIIIYLYSFIIVTYSYVFIILFLYFLDYRPTCQAKLAYSILASRTPPLCQGSCHPPQEVGRGSYPTDVFDWHFPGFGIFFSSLEKLLPPREVFGQYKKI